MTLAQFPTAKSTIQNVPVGIVNQDQGPIGKTITKKVIANKTKAAHADQPMFKWHEYQTVKAANRSLSFNGNYATVIIPKNLSQSVQSVSQTGKPARIKIIINQGRNHTLATNVSSILNNLFNKVGASVGTGILAKMGQLNLTIPATKAAAIANPIKVQTKIVHSTKNLEAASSVFFQPIWITSLATTMLLYFASRSFKPKHKKDVFAFKGTVVVIVAILALVVGFVTTFYVSQFLGYQFPDSTLISLFLAIATFAFIMLFSGVIAWIGIPGVVIFALLMFFSLPLMMMAPQMLPQAYQDYFLPWLPMKFLYEGLREILYFKAGILNQNTWGLIIIAGIGLIMFFLESFGKRHQKTFI